MSEYTHFPTNFISRTKENLNMYKGKYDVTNLINNCLGLIIIPKQQLNENLPQYTFNQQDKTYGITQNNITLESQSNYSLRNIIRHIRNGLAHGRIEQRTENNKIVGLRIHDKPNDKASENFSIEFSIEEFRVFAESISNEFLIKKIL